MNRMLGNFVDGRTCRELKAAEERRTFRVSTYLTQDQGQAFLRACGAVGASISEVTRELVLAAVEMGPASGDEPDADETRTETRTEEKERR